MPLLAHQTSFLGETLTKHLHETFNPTATAMLKTTRGRWLDVIGSRWEETSYVRFITYPFKHQPPAGLDTDGTSVTFEGVVSDGGGLTGVMQ